MSVGSRKSRFVNNSYSRSLILGFYPLNLKNYAKLKRELETPKPSRLQYITDYGAHNELSGWWGFHVLPMAVGSVLKKEFIFLLSIRANCKEGHKWNKILISGCCNSQQFSCALRQKRKIQRS